MLKFIKKYVKEFLDIYQDEEQIRESYGDEYADRFSAVNPNTGKKKISAAKVAKRIVIVLIVVFWLFICVRLMTYGGA